MIVSGSWLSVWPLRAMRVTLDRLVVCLALVVYWDT